MEAAEGAEEEVAVVGEVVVEEGAVVEGEAGVVVAVGRVPALVRVRR